MSKLLKFIIFIMISSFSVSETSAKTYNIKCVFAGGEYYYIQFNNGLINKKLLGSEYGTKGAYSEVCSDPIFDDLKVICVNSNRTDTYYFDADGLGGSIYFEKHTVNARSSKVNCFAHRP